MIFLWKHHYSGLTKECTLEYRCWVWLCWEKPWEYKVKWKKPITKTLMHNSIYVKFLDRRKLVSGSLTPGGMSLEEVSKGYRVSVWVETVGFQNWLWWCFHKSEYAKYTEFMHFKCVEYVVFGWHLHITIIKRKRGQPLPSGFHTGFWKKTSGMVSSRWLAKRPKGKANSNHF